MLIATRRSILCYYVLLRDPTGKIWNGGGGGTPIYKLYDYVPLWRGWFSGSWNRHSNQKKNTILVECPTSYAAGLAKLM